MKDEGQGEMLGHKGVKLRREGIGQEREGSKPEKG